MKENHIDIVTMGCSKNFVDTEQLTEMLQAKGYTVNLDSEQPEGSIAIINTCGFIDAAKQESISVVLQFAKRKDDGELKQLYVCGCLSQRYEELQRLIPQIDHLYGKFNQRELAEDLPVASSPFNQCGQKCNQDASKPYSTYIKISEGCDRKCAYCAIPIITGRHKSRTIDEVIDEVRLKASRGVKEYNIIAQDLTYYGIDLNGEKQIAELIQQISTIQGVEWIRLHYAYPDNFPMDLLNVIRDNPKVCHYLDIALQHISANVLKRMRRSTSQSEIKQLIETIRHEVPDIHLRTTFIVGFPEETEEDFEELVRFVQEMRFERLGVFAYSHEEGTYSHKHYKDNVPEEVKQSRLGRLMAVQQTISEEVAAEKIDTLQSVIIDREDGNYFIGRTQYDSPDVDGEVLIDRNLYPNLKVGNIEAFTITDADEFDLYASR